MKQLLFVDTDIVLDLLARREPFYNAAARLFSLAETGDISLAVSSLTFANLFNFLRKQVSAKHAHGVLSSFKQLVTVLPVDDAGKDSDLDLAACSRGRNSFQNQRTGIILKKAFTAEYAAKSRRF